MFRLRTITLAMCAALPLGLPALGMQQDWPVDPKTATRILDFINDTGNAADFIDIIGLSPETAQLIIELKTGTGTPTDPPKQFNSLKELNSIWSQDHAAFSLFDARYGPRTMGRWDILPYSFPISPVNSIVTHTGYVLVIDENGSTTTTQWDPSDRENGIFIAPEAKPTLSLWCSHSAELSDGRVLVAGGGGGGPNVNSDQAHIFEPLGGANGNGIWVEIDDMNFERWYPTEVALGYPYTLIVGGVDRFNAVVLKMEIYNEATDSFTTVSGNGADLNWPPMYPGMHLIPDGKLLFTRTGFQLSPNDPPSQYLSWNDYNNPLMGGSWTPVGPMVFPDRTEGMSLMFYTPTDDVYEYKARVAVFGGGWGNASGRNTAEIIDCENLQAGTPWVRLPDMAEDRFHGQGVLMPDGKALLWGGVNNHFDISNSGSRSSEIFDPCSDTFTLADELTWARGYHSVAALLPSGEIMTSGGLGFPPDAADKTIEVYRPPYMFKGPRPRITGSPADVQYGDTFDVMSPDAERIEKVVLVRPSSFSHHTDSEQRVLELRFTKDLANGKLVATAPIGITRHPIAPAGYYLMFILDCEGIPSEGTFIKLK